MSEINHIKIYSVVSKGCIFFDGSTVQPKFLGTILAEAHPTRADRVVIFRTDRTSRTDSAQFRTIFRKLNINRIQNVYGEDLVATLGYTRDQVVQYINDEANKTDVVSSGQSFTLGDSIDFIRDETNTSILFSNGDHHGVNAVRAELKDNGLVGIFPARGDVELYEIDPSIITINSTAPAGTAQSVVDALNALFTVSATPAPLAIPTFQLEDGEALPVTEIDTALDTNGMIRNLTDGTKYHGPRLYTTATINEPGEYFTFDALNTVAGGGPLLGLGLYDAGSESNDLSEIQADNLSNSGNHGYWWSMWLYNYSGYSAPWTTYGSNSGLGYGPGWNGSTSEQFRYSDAALGFREPNNVPSKFRVGITDEGFVGVWYYDREIDNLSQGYGPRTNGWILMARSSAPLPQGEYGLLVKLPTDSVQIVPGSFERFATADLSDNDLPSPELFYRYIESPDGVFHYPLFSTAAEANYVSSDGQSHTHMYPDDSTNTVWYMPGASHGDDTTTYSVDLDGRPVDFPGGYTADLGEVIDPISWTEIVSLTDAMQVPSTFYGLPLSVDEGESVIYQTQPMDTNYVTTFSGLPAGLVDAGGGVIMGTAPEVGGADDNVTTPSQTFTVSVIRTNSFGSSTGTFDITVANLTPPSVLPVGFTQLAGDFTDNGPDENGNNTYTLNDSSVVQLDVSLEVGKRVIIPAAWADANVLPFIDDSVADSKAFIGVPDVSPNWANTPDLHADFDAVVRWEATSNISHKHSMSVGDLIDANHITMLGTASAGLSYAIEWDGTTLYVIRSTSVTDLETKDIAALATEAVLVISDAPATPRTGTLPLVVATRSGGSMNITSAGLSVIDAPAAPVSSILTSWTKALDFSGSSERAQQVTTQPGYNTLRMNGLAAYTDSINDPAEGRISSDGNARPWATAIVFKADRNNSNQHIWNSGEGTGGDNIYLRLSSAGDLFFGWGRPESSGQLNECRIAQQILSNQWVGVYVGHNGTRLTASNGNASDPTAANLADAFDIRIATDDTNWTLSSELSTPLNWITTGGRMDRTVAGDFTIGGRGSNRSFHGKVASMVITTLRRSWFMPDDTEIKMMITDPKQWEQDYRIDQTVRTATGGGNTGYNPEGVANGWAGTQIWLMGDGVNDSYSNMIRNQVDYRDQNYTKLNLISMQSNDIQNVTISGLSD